MYEQTPKSFRRVHRPPAALPVDLGGDSVAGVEAPVRRGHSGSSGPGTQTERGSFPSSSQAEPPSLQTIVKFYTLAPGPRRRASPQELALSASPFHISAKPGQRVMLWALGIFRATSATLGLPVGMSA